MIICATDIIVFEDKKVATLFNAGIGIVVQLFHNGLVAKLKKNVVRFWSEPSLKIRKIFVLGIELYFFSI